MEVLGTLAVEIASDENRATVTTKDIFRAVNDLGFHEEMGSLLKQELDAVQEKKSSRRASRSSTEGTPAKKAKTEEKLEDSSSKKEEESENAVNQVTRVMMEDDEGSDDRSSRPVADNQPCLDP